MIAESIQDHHLIDQIFDKILANTPPHSEEVDRQDYFGQNIEKLTPPERSVLRKKVEEFLLFMRQKEASDIEIGGVTAKRSIWLRIQGRKEPYSELGKWSLDQFDILTQSLISSKQRERLLQNKVTDFSYAMEIDGKLFRWRATLYFDMGHLALNMRSIASEVYPYSKLNFHANISRSLSLRHEKQGLILLTGITGSGKSTTMDSIIDANNQTSDGHIVIIADPVEFIHQSKRCIVRHREVGRDVASFKDGAIQALRQDPDIIIVGEMRDPETIMTCLEISDTGHKAFSTLHTGSAVETIARIVAEVPTEEQERVRMRLADQLRVVISQKLVPDRRGKLTLAKEVLLVTTSVRAAIRNKNVHEIYQMISEGGRLGMITLEQDLVRLCRQGIVAEETACDYANNIKRIKELLN
jgi:twitching motility protein PilT